MSLPLLWLGQYKKVVTKHWNRIFGPGDLEEAGGGASEEEGLVAAADDTPPAPEGEDGAGAAEVVEAGGAGEEKVRLFRHRACPCLVCGWR